MIARGPRPSRPETMLLIHGAGMSARAWTGQLRGLSPTLQVLALDLPGHGASDPSADSSVASHAEAAFRLLTTLGVASTFVAGHSLGGAVALALAAHRPELVKGLVLIASCAKAPSSAGLFQAALGALPSSIHRMLFFSAARSYLFAIGASNTAVHLALKDLHNCKPETIRKDIIAARTLNLEQHAANLRVPTLVLCGSSDMVTPLRLSERLSTLIPGAQLSVVDQAGHMLPLEAPERVNREILEFVSGIKAGSARRSVSVLHAVRRGMGRLLTEGFRAL